MPKRVSLDDRTTKDTQEEAPGLFERTGQRYKVTLYLDQADREAIEEIQIAVRKERGHLPSKSSLFREAIVDLIDKYAVKTA